MLFEFRYSSSSRRPRGGHVPVNSIYLPGTITFSHLAVKKWSLAWATREQWRQFSTPFPRHIVRQFQSLYTPSPRGLIATPYSTSVSVPLHAITARSITNQLASSGVSIGFTFLPHVIIPDKRHGVHWYEQVGSECFVNLSGFKADKTTF
jgi:hypothetical protein